MPAVLFTSETASEMARRSHLPTSARFQPKPIPANVVAQTHPQTQPADEYTERRIRVTREQIRLLDKQLESCDEAKDLKAIADAIYRLSDLERQLSGRPLPGTLKPERKAKTVQVWSEPEPVSTPQQVVTCVCDDPSI